MPPMTIMMVLILAVMPNHQVGLNSQLALRNQVQRYYRYFSSGRYDLMWELSSKSLREKNGHDKKAYIRQLRAYGFGKVKSELSEIEIDGDRARVRMKITVWSKPDKKWFSEINDETWVFEEGRWVFEDHRLAKSATTGEGT